MSKEMFGNGVLPLFILFQDLTLITFMMILPYQLLTINTIQSRAVHGVLLVIWNNLVQDTPSEDISNSLPVSESFNRKANI